ncbi:MAG: glycerol-3-phosphate 1-O-acyltransferase PlsY [Chitinivibrionia bacterium]|nr:glycerol-3-phosphate 1-O-acyltransferase PlsY [Chitinivibrionia bacterium]
MPAFIAIALASYLLGAIPFSYIAGKIFAGIDLREHGSGNLGASNTFRMLGPKIAIPVLIGDIAKGFLPVRFAYLANTAQSLSGAADAPVLQLMLVAALAAVIGHMYSVFVGFSGGKGIATTAGAFLALVPWAFLGAFIVWLLFFAASRIVSLASLAGAVTLPLFVYASGRLGMGDPHWSLLALSFVITLVVLFKHKANIRRLMAGTEPALSRKKK